MAKKKEVYRVKPLNENKKNIISALIEEYDIETADDIQEALKDLLGGTIKSMMESEMDEHLGYESYERSDNENYRNGTKRKTVRSNYGEFQIDVPQDRQSSFEPKVVKKRQKDISGIDQQIISMYARGLTGIKEAINTAYPDTEYQRCIVHQVRNTLKYVYCKDMKSFAADLKSIYLAPNEQQGYDNLQRVKEKWEEKYPNAMRSWEQNWDVLTPIFKFSSDVRKVIYTTNAIESLNSTYKKMNRQRTVFPSDKALLKSLYLST